MSRIVRLPEPPYYAVVAPAVLAGDAPGYAAAAPQVLASAQEIEGFLGIESCGQPGFSLAVSYWRSLEAIDEWRHHPVHRRAKGRGTGEWFSAYATRIARVVDQY